MKLHSSCVIGISGGFIWGVLGGLFLTVVLLADRLVWEGDPESPAVPRVRS